ncbi:hypothetical protein AOH447_10090 [Helicobacter pylori]
MVTPLQSLRLPIGHPLVEILCDLSLKNKDKDKVAFNKKARLISKKKYQKNIKSSSSKHSGCFMRLSIMRLL